MSVKISGILDFEKPIFELEDEIRAVKAVVESGDVSKIADVERLEKKLAKLEKDIYGKLTAIERVKLSRHASRPFTLDYVNLLFSDVMELHGDRLSGDDAAIVSGLGVFNEREVAFVGHQRGRTLEEKMKRNFGMPQPEGNRKAQRIFKLAGKFNLPLLLFIDTQGAYPGLEAEERGQAESIATNLYILSTLPVPIISTVIGEGGSGGALALGVCDRLIMLENSIYSVITPEGCASILWGKGDQSQLAEYAAQAAEALGVTAESLAKCGIADAIVEEPKGGAHRDFSLAAKRLGEQINLYLNELVVQEPATLLRNRYRKFREIGECREG